MDKPRGFAVLGRGEALAFLAAQPVGLLAGVGKAFQGKLKRDGITRIGQLQGMEEKALIRRYGVIGSRLARFSRGQDARAVNPHGAAKSISSERTFDVDIADLEELEKRLWAMSENVSASLKSKDLAGGTVTLKLRLGLSRTLTRSSKLDSPTQLAQVIFERGRQLLGREATGNAFRLLGIGVSGLTGTGGADQPDLLDPGAAKKAVAERAMDRVRGRFGDDAIKKGRAL
jgi:DNA polymerase-4